MLLKAIPVLPSVNLRATMDFYETRLGFTGINMGNFAIVKSGFAEIYFYLITDINKFHPASCVLCTDNLEDLYTNFAEKDMLYEDGKIEDMPFGSRVFSIQDNNGNVLRFIKKDK